MSLSIKLTSSVCQARCRYCYEHPIREKGRDKRRIDLDALFEQMEKEWKGRDHGCSVPYLHGGEALLADLDILEKVMAKSFELAGRTSIQTYGYMITPEHIELFKRYKCNVGISLDGPWPLNKAREVPGKDTKEITERVMRNILELRNAGIGVSIICLLHKLNALPEPRKKLKDWLFWLQDNGICNGRLNLMQCIGSGEELQLTEEEAADAWVDLARFVLLENDDLRWQPFHDIVTNLLGLEQGTCIFTKCQYYHAHTEPVIFGDGKTGNCLKTCGQEGNIYPRYPEYRWHADPEKGFGLVRYDVLPNVPQEDGGCKDCKYWHNCYGGCAGEGIDNDWRNRSRFCGAYYALFHELEKILRRLMPNITLSCDEGVELGEHQVGGMRPNAFERILKGQRPSSWRNNPPTKSREMRVGVKKNPHEHIDGNVRHLDSDASPEELSGIEHRDGDIRHLDGVPGERGCR